LRVNKASYLPTTRAINVYYLPLFNFLRGDNLLILGKGRKYIIISLMLYKEYYLPLVNFLKGDNLI
jgi:hypothetical protein